MPELPDVEVFKQYLQSTAFRKKIDEVEIRSRDMLEGVSISEVKNNLEGESLVSARRHGKYLFTKPERGKWLVLHFGMTGFFKYFKDYTKKPAHSRLLLHFSNGYHLAYDCQRKLGRIALTNDPDLFIKERQSGPDALDPDFDLDRFRESFKSINATIKSALMNQKYVAGIGNIYSDEILFQAGIHPDTKSSQLADDKMERLHSEMDRVLEAAIEARADPHRLPSSFIIPHRRGDGVCPKCRSVIEKTKIGGRTAYYCPQCQRW